jgi:riboflavin synthase
VYNLAVFTGLVQSTGILVETRPRPDGRVLVIDGQLDPRDLELGASVAVNGVCLTVVAAAGSRFEFEAAFETLRKTTLGDKSVGDRVNLEPSLRMGDALGGHLVSGHVDGLARLRSSEARGDARELWFDVPDTLGKFIAPKGSVALDGVSLTVNEVDDRGFMVGIIPHTLSVTTLGDLAVGAAVNLEVDLLARYVARLLQFGVAGARDSATDSKVTLQTLAEAGYLDESEAQ